jgi:hypothetical protein
MDSLIAESAGYKHSQKQNDLFSFVGEELTVVLE